MAAKGKSSAASKSSQHQAEAGLSTSQKQAAAQVGQLTVSGRYHKAPKKIEDDYDIATKVLGNGYNGAVHLAEGKLNKGQYAVKQFKLAGVGADKRTQLETEVEIFLVMDHPHIARLMDVYETREHLYLVMECMQGGELFDRVIAMKRFSERDAADAAWQMLLSLNYLHSHGIVHRDLKLENFLYESKESNHLKLIDFGFSKVWNPNIKMHACCGTLSYVAPEVLMGDYTSQCDVWSLGVIVFILLSGYMPFSGAEDVQQKKIKAGTYTMKPEKWNNISKDAKDFVLKTLQKDPKIRLTAEAALDHQWIDKRASASSAPTVNADVVDALRCFGQASKFRRMCMKMMAWSLTNEDRSKVRDYFIEMDKNHQGTIKLSELRDVLVDKFHIPDAEAMQIFSALDENNDDEVHYSDFLAAMVSSRISMYDDLLRSAFSKFDTDNSGYITTDNMKQVLGETCSAEEVGRMMGEADFLKDGRISFPEFVAYVKGTPLEQHQDMALRIVDREIEKRPEHSSRKNPTLVVQQKESGASGTQNRNSHGSMKTHTSAAGAADVAPAEESPKKKKEEPKCCAMQ